MGEKILSGIPGLDQIPNGGFPESTVILLSGAPGTGKTLFSLSYLLEGAKKNEKCFYLSLSEKEDELLRACSNIDSLKELKKFNEKNFIVGHLQIGSKISLEEFSNLLAEYPLVDRIVVDNLNKLLLSSETQREYRLSLGRLISILKAKSKSTILISETFKDEIDTGQGEAFDVDGVIYLSFMDLEEKPMRSLEIQKMRYTDFEPLLKHNLIINKKGISISSKKMI